MFMKTCTRRFASLFLFTMWLASTYGQAGAIDVNFGENGYVKANFDNTGGHFSSIMTQQDGKIVAVGNTLHDVEVKRFLPNGQKDTQFGNNGTKIIEDFNTYSTAGGLSPEGKILAIYVGYGNSPSSPTVVKIVRLLPNGNVDASFGSNGTATLDVPGVLDVLSDKVYFMPTGDIVFAGGTKNISYPELKVIKLKSNGSLDANFGQNGVLKLPVNNGFSKLRTSFQLPNRLVLATSRDNYNWITVYRIFDNGSNDPSFGDNGKKEIYYQDPIMVGGVLGLDNGQIAVAASNGQYGATYNYYLSMLQPSGEPAASFGNNGIAAVNMNEPALATGLAKQSDGKFLIGGMTGLGDGEDYSITRVGTDGSIDHSFGSLGIAKTFDNNGDHCSTTMTLQGNGKILIGGFSTYGQASMARYLTENANGVDDLDLGISNALIYPNPTAGAALVKFNLAKSETTNLSLLDAVGRTIWTEKTYRLQGVNEQALPMQDLPAGIYFVKIQTETGIATQKIEKS